MLLESDFQEAEPEPEQATKRIDSHIQSRREEKQIVVSRTRVLIGTNDTPNE